MLGLVAPADVIGLWRLPAGSKKAFQCLDIK
jgi:hypothetical protein